MYIYTCVSLPRRACMLLRLRVRLSVHVYLHMCVQHASDFAQVSTPLAPKTTTTFCTKKRRLESMFKKGCVQPSSASGTATEHASNAL